MKMICGALALTFAVPAMAQTAAPAADPHAEHKGMDHSKMDHGKMDHSKMDCCKDGKGDCCKDKKSGCCEDGKGDCCKGAKGTAKSPAPAAHSGHDH